jgi:hypothetical protein
VELWIRTAADDFKRLIKSKRRCEGGGAAIGGVREGACAAAAEERPENWGRSPLWNSILELLCGCFCQVVSLDLGKTYSEI